MTDQKDSQPLRGNERIEALMPWLRHQELSPADEKFIGNEIMRSPEFEAMLAEETALADALEAIAAEEGQDSAADADAAWSAFKNRLPEARADGAARAAHEIRQRAKGSARVSLWRRLPMPQTGLGWLATAQTAALAAFAFVLVPAQLGQDNEDYRTLSAGSDGQIPAGNAVLIFKPTTPEATMRQILAAANARIVDGPMANGGYVVMIAEDELFSTISALKANDAMLVAETLEGGSEP